MPVAGDWNGNGTDGIGLYDPGTGMWYLKHTPTAGPADIAFQFRPVISSEIRAIAGDWDGDGVDTPGLYDRLTGTWYLRNSNTAGGYDQIYTFGPGQPATLMPDPCNINTPVNSNKQDWWPVAGDWDGDGRATLGVMVRKYGLWYLRGTNDPFNAEGGFTLYFGP